MAQLVPVADPADPRLADFLNLRDVQLRKTLEVEEGLFIAEGEKVIRRAVEAGHPVRSFLMSRKWVDGLADVLDRTDAPAYVVDDATAERVTGFAVHRGALAAMVRLPLPSVSSVVSGARGIVVHGSAEVSKQHTSRRILVLEDLVDHGNVGAIFRCAAALGVDGVILSPRCADPLYRRAIKVSMGAVFAIPYARMTNWYGGLTELREAGYQLLALTPDQSSMPMDEVVMEERVALLLGSEGDGLSSRWLHEADQSVCIAMSKEAMALGVDSLNVVAAAAIACHSLMRARNPR